MPINSTYTDGDYTVARSRTLPVFEAPFEGVNTEYILRQTWFQNQADKTPLALNTAHPDHADFVLVKEGPETDLGEGVVEWERIYARLPDSYDEPGGNYNYNFIGMLTVTGVNVPDYGEGRARFQKNVPMKLQHDFFLVGTGGSVATWQEIPEIEATRYYYSSDPNFDQDYLTDSPPFSTPTVPSKTAYETLITADAADEASFSLVVETTKAERWMGNIYKRTTMRIKAI